MVCRNLEQPQKPTAKRQQETGSPGKDSARHVRLPCCCRRKPTAHYAGKGVSLGAADKPIFWYRPKDGKKYRVIYADLSVRDADTPPSVPVVPVAQPEKDLIEMFRHYSELSGGPFPTRWTWGRL